MAPHQKCCAACHQAKRRCDLRIPKCGRCSTKDLTCQYRITQDSVRSQPSLCVLEANSYPQINSTISRPPSGGISNPALTDLDVDWSGSDLLLSPYLQSCPLDELNLSLEQTSMVEMAPSTVQYCISQLRSYPDLFARYGRTPFIHSRLYQENMPSPMQHAFTICVLNAGKSDLQRDMTYIVLNAEVHELLRAESSLSTFEDYLAHVQALILCQIVRLFDENVCQRTFAEQHDAVLAKWTDTLQSYLMQLFSPFLPCTAVEESEWKTWILMGSARRTVLTSHFLRGLYYARKTGVCSTVAVMADLPVSTRAVLWELESPTRWQLALKAAEPVLMPYKDYTTQWEEGSLSCADVGGFERLLIVACSGREKYEQRSGIRIRMHE
ncbi:hypothetical protein EV356DRAFT_471828 [Viridothelium virens]|uniref:Zn(2)-C6 fungal-type domain-containing protein n=1 Tax=Viridothelium virens TaxID=1048519 RepID=A0A6A6H0H5_VIRVR|nr:hypothetical protein EV356DRAFT_471828 [Viridothelium virens]